MLDRILHHKFGFILAPIFFALAFVLSVYQHNMTELFLSTLIGPVLIIFVAIIALSFLSLYLLSDRIKAGLFLCIFALLFFSFGEVVRLLEKINSEIAFVKILFFLWLIFIIAIFVWLKKSQRDFTKQLHFLTICSAIAVLLPLVVIAKFEITDRLSAKVNNKQQETIDLKIDKNKLSEAPDIYYLIPDSYGSSKVLADLYKFDNHKFINFLHSRGFVVPENHTTNYPKTFLSVTSTLNLDYLDKFNLPKKSSDIAIVAPYLNNNLVARSLKEVGYKYYQLGSWWQFTHSSSLADKNFLYEGGSFSKLDLFSYAILQSTFISPVIEKFFAGKTVGNSPADSRKRTEYQFTKLTEISKMPGPKFVFAHILSPHVPYVFDEKCGEVSTEYSTSISQENKYLKQIECINSKLELVIDEILKNSNKSPIIIIQSDEGVAFLQDNVGHVGDWSGVSDNFLRHKFPVMAAYYLPKFATSSKMTFSSNVNIFRYIFQRYFNANLEILPDKNFVYRGQDHYYDFVDVSAKIKSN